VSAEHTNLPRSYPHTRVTGYEPPCSYHHVFTTIHEPTRSWHNISWTKSASLRITTYASHIPAAFRLAQPKCRQTKPVQTAWRDVLVARRQASHRPTVARFITWQITPCHQAPHSAGTPHVSPIAWHTYSCRQALY